MSDSDVEVLNDAVEATEEETHAQNQEQVGQHTSNQRGLDDKNLILRQSDDTDNQFGSVTKTGIEETSQGFTSVQSKFFGSEGQHGSERNDGDKVDDEDGISVGVCVPESKTDGNTDEKNIDPRAKDSGLKLADDTDFRAPLLLGLTSIRALEVRLICLGAVGCTEQVHEGQTLSRFVLRLSDVVLRHGARVVPVQRQAFLFCGWFDVGLADQGSIGCRRVGRGTRLRRGCVGMMWVSEVGIVYIAHIVAPDAAVRHDLVRCMATLQVVLLVLGSSNIRPRASGERVVIRLAVVVSPGDVSGLMLD